MIAQIIIIDDIFVFSHIVSPIYIDEIQIKQDISNFHGDRDQCALEMCPCRHISIQDTSFTLL